MPFVACCASSITFVESSLSFASHFPSEEVERTLRVLDARWRDVEIILEDVPQQGRRSNDCGVFVCLFSLCIATDPAAPITLPTDLGSFSRQARLLVAGVAARDGPGLEAFNRMYKPQR